MVCKQPSCLFSVLCGLLTRHAMSCVQVVNVAIELDYIRPLSAGLEQLAASLSQPRAVVTKAEQQFCFALSRAAPPSIDFKLLDSVFEKLVQCMSCGHN